MTSRAREAPKKVVRLDAIDVDGYKTTNIRAGLNEDGLDGPNHRGTYSKQDTLLHPEIEWVHRGRGRYLPASQDSRKPQRAHQAKIYNDAKYYAASEGEEEEEEEITRCVCGQQEYPGMRYGEAFNTSEALRLEDTFLLCDGCSVWQHCGCVGILEESHVPEKYYCDQCKPELHEQYTDPRGQKYSLYQPVYRKTNRENSVGEQLRNHETAHMESRKYECHLCGKAFTDISALMEHTMRENMMSEMRLSQKIAVQDEAQQPAISRHEVQQAAQRLQALAQRYKKHYKGLHNLPTQCRNQLLMLAQRFIMQRSSREQGARPTQSALQQSTNGREPIPGSHEEDET